MKKSYMVPGVKLVQVVSKDICTISNVQGVLNDGVQWGDIRPFGNQ